MTPKEEGFDVIVVGGGAAGMMAAGTAAERGLRVLLIERNRKLGEKLSITGGGRCNITNAEQDVRAFLGHFGKAEQFLYSSFSQFGVQDTFQFFEKRGLPLVVQARKRAFPETEKAADVTRLMKKFCTDKQVQLRTEARVTKILTKEGRVVGVVADGISYFARAFIFATGGASRPETGSSGDGFSWLKALGHTVNTPTPTIVPLAVSNKWVHALSGTSLSFMKINFFLDGTKQFSETGKILFTHFGLSGPLILNCAGKVAELLEAGSVSATIDAYPHTDLGSLEKKIVAVFDENKNKQLKTVLPDILPEGLAAAAHLIWPDIDMEQRVHSITKEARKHIVHTLKALPVQVTGLMGFDRAVVADGGVPLEEIDTRTFVSKKHENVYIVGDLLHITRPSGGYSLQLCWTSGFVAGSAVCADS
jgi:hypothetical protein